MRFCVLVLWLSIVFLRFIHIAVCITNWFLWMNNIHIYMITCVYPFICCWTLNCFYLLAIVNTVAVTGMYIYLFEYPLSIILDMYLDLKVEFGGRIVILCLTFWGTNKCFFSTNEPSYILIRVVQLCYSLFILASVFPFRSCSGYKVIPDIDKWNRK